MINRLIAAAGEQPLGPIQGIGTIGNPGANAPTVLAQMISTVIGLLTVITAIYFLITLISGAIGIISSGGDKGSYADARNKITAGVIGLTVAIAGVFILDIVANLLGIPTILDLAATILQISQ